MEKKPMKRKRAISISGRGERMDCGLGAVPASQPLKQNSSKEWIVGLQASKPAREAEFL